MATDLLYPLPKEFNPDFLDPKTKPLEVEIDWDNPVTNGLKSSINDFKHDSVSGDKLAIFDESDDSPSDFNRTPDGSYDTPVGGGLADYTDIDSSFVSSDFSFVTRLACDDASYKHALTIANESGDWAAIRSGTDEIALNINWNQVVIPAPQSEFITVAVTRTGDLWQVWADGGFIGSITQTRDFSSATTFRVAAHTNQNYTWGGRISCLHVWDRALTASEAVSLTESPYQILKPVQQDYAYLQLATYIDLFYPLPKEFNPDFSDPRVKPLDAEIDYSNGLTKDLIVVATLERSDFTNLVGDVSVTGESRIPTRPSVRPTKYGLGLNFTTNYVGAKITDSTVLGDHDNYTFVFARSPNDITNRICSAWGINTAVSAEKFSPNLPDANGDINFDFGGDTGNNRLSYTGYSKVADQLEIWVFTAGTKGMSIWKDGTKLASHGVSVSRTAGVTDDFWLNFGVGTNGDYQTIYAAYMYKEALTDAEIVSVSKDVYQILKPVQEPIVVLAAEGVTEGELTITGNVSQTISGLTQDLTGSEISSISGNITQTLSGVTQDLSGTVIAPEVTASGFTYTLPTITGSHTDLPILLKTVDFPSGAIDGSATALLDGGGNLRAYTDDTKTTRLSVDIVILDSSGTPNAEVWIKLPTAITGSTIYIEADEVATSQPAVDAAFGQESVWTEAAAVFLMDQSASDDRSGNYTFTDTGTPTNIAGPYGRANSFAGTDRYTTTEDAVAGILGTNDVTITTLSRSSATNSGEPVIAWESPTGALYPRNTGGDGDCVAFWWNGNVWNATTTVPQSADWTHLAVTTRASTDHELYHQGGSIATSSSGRSGGDANTTFRIGGYQTGSQNFNGDIAQVVIWSTAKSSDWIEVGYDNQSSATAWGTVGEWTGAVSGPLLTGNISQTLSSVTQALSGTVALPTGEITGNVTQNISALTQALTGSDISSQTGNVTQSIGALTQGLVGTVAGASPPVTGMAGYTYTLPTITGTLVDLPVLLKTSDFPAEALDGSATAIANGGGNLRAYVDDTKVLRLSVDVVTLVSSGSPEAEVWIKVPSAVTGSTIYIEADGVETTQPAVDAAFGRNDVWTEAETALLMDQSASVDRTGNYTWADTGTPSNIAGPFGRANSFAGTDRYTTTEAALAGILSTNNTTISIIVRTASELTGKPALAWESGTGGLYPWTTDGPGNAISFWWSGNLWETQISPVGASVWQHIDITTRALGDNEMYYQGGSVATSASARNGASSTFRVGGWGTSSQNYDNDIAQVIVYKTARSDGWITALYDMTSAPSNWGTVGAWEEANTTTPVGNITQSVSNLTQSLTGTETSNIAGDITHGISSLTQSLIGSSILEGFVNGNIAQTISTLTQGLTGSDVSNLTGNVVQNLQGLTQGLTGSAIPTLFPVYFRTGSVGGEVVYLASNTEAITYISRVGHVTQNITGLNQDLSGSVVTPTGSISGDITQSIAGLTQGLTGTETSNISGDVTQTISALSQSISAVLIAPGTVTGNLTQTLGNLSQGLLGTEISNISGDVTQSIGALTQSLTGSEISSINGDVSQFIGNLSQGLVGSVTLPPPLVGDINQTLGNLTQGLTGNDTSSISGDVIQSISGLTQNLSATATISLPEATGDIIQTLGGLSQSGVWVITARPPLAVASSDAIIRRNTPSEVCMVTGTDVHILHRLSRRGKVFSIPTTATVTAKLVSKDRTMDFTVEVEQFSTQERASWDRGLIDVQLPSDILDTIIAANPTWVRGTVPAILQTTVSGARRQTFTSQVLVKFRVA